MSEQSMPVVVTRLEDEDHVYDTPMYRVRDLSGSSFLVTPQRLARLGLAEPPVTITVELTEAEIDSWLDMHRKIEDPHDGWARAHNKIRRALLGDRTETEVFDGD